MLRLTHCNQCKKILLILRIFFFKNVVFVIYIFSLSGTLTLGLDFRGTNSIYSMNIRSIFTQITTSVEQDQHCHVLEHVHFKHFSLHGNRNFLLFNLFFHICACDQTFAEKYGVKNVEMCFFNNDFPEQSGKDYSR